MEEDKSYGESDIDPVHQSIATALSYGYSPTEILDTLKSSPKKEHQEWYKKYSERNNEKEEAVPVQQNEPNHLLKKFHEMTPVELGLGAAGLGMAVTGGNQLIRNAVSRVFPSASEKQYAEQNRIQQEKLNKNIGVAPNDVSAHEQALRDHELLIAQEKLNQERIKTQKLQQSLGVKPVQATPSPVTPAQASSSITLPNTNIGPVTTTPNPNPMAVVNQVPGLAPAPTNAPTITPTNSAPNALPGAVNTQAVPGTMPAPQQSAQPAEVPNQPVNTPAQQLAENITSEPPTNPASTAQPTAQVEANPVESGEGASPLHEPGKEAGATQIETTEKSTGNQKLKTEGAKEPPFNKEYTPKGMIKNPVKKTKDEEIGRGLFNWLQGQEGPNAEAVYRDLYGVGNKPYNEENVNKYAAWKQSVPPGMEMNDKLSMRGNYKRQEFVPESMRGSADLKTMATLLAGGGSAALIGYMMKNHPDFAEHYTKALQSMGENFTTEGLVGHNKAEELSPAMRQIFLKSGNPVYRKELNEQLSTEKDPERIKELKRELEKAK